MGPQSRKTLVLLKRGLWQGKDTRGEHCLIGQEGLEGHYYKPRDAKGSKRATEDGAEPFPSRKRVPQVRWSREWQTHGER